MEIIIQKKSHLSPRRYPIKKILEVNVTPKILYKENLNSGELIVHGQLVESLSYAADNPKENLCEANFKIPFDAIICKELNSEIKLEVLHKDYELVNSTTIFQYFILRASYK